MPLSSRMRAKTCGMLTTLRRGAPPGNTLDDAVRVAHAELAARLADVEEPNLLDRRDRNVAQCAGTTVSLPVQIHDDPDIVRRRRCPRPQRHRAASSQE